MGAYKDLTGARIGRLTVIQNTHQKVRTVVLFGNVYVIVVTKYFYQRLA